MEWTSLIWLTTGKVASTATKLEEFIDYLSNCQFAKMDFAAESE